MNKYEKLKYEEKNNEETGGFDVKTVMKYTIIHCHCISLIPITLLIILACTMCGNPIH